MYSHPDIRSIVVTLRTTDDVRVLLVMIDRWQKHLYEVDKHNVIQPMSVFEHRLYTQIGKIVENVPDKDAFFSDLRKEIHTCKQVTVVVGIIPTEHMIMTWSAWIQTHVGEGVVMDISIDATLLGGAQLIYEGKYLDYSIVPRISSIYSSVIAKEFV